MSQRPTRWHCSDDRKVSDQHPPAGESEEVPPGVIERSARIEPGTPEWRYQVAALAHKFFNLAHSEKVARWIGMTITPNVVDPWAVIDFYHYITKIGIRSSGSGEDVTRLCSAMERAGLLVPAGWHPKFTLLGQQYISQHKPNAQKNGNGVLWLSETLGAELIIPAYERVTALIHGVDEQGIPNGGIGTGLILDRRRLITNRHVIEQLSAGGGSIGVKFPGNPPPGNCQITVSLHEHIDFALIELSTDAFQPLDGMVFRDPEWTDEVYVFGYPPVPLATDDVMTVQRGEVVSPSAESPAAGGSPRQKFFLYSAIARPGNSGGPIVAHDGRVIGMVFEDSMHSTRAAAAGYEEPRPQRTWERIDHLNRDVEEIRIRTSAPAFYRGIPASEIMTALEAFGSRGAALFEGVDPPDHLPGEKATIHYDLSPP